MSYVGRSAASAVSAGVAGNARMNLAGEAVNTPWEIQMLLEGRIFAAGTGMEETGIAGIADIDEQKPIFALVAPAGGVVLIPLWFRVYYDTEGAAAPEHIHLIYVQADKAAFSAGTALPSINCLGGANPRTAQGKFQHTLSSLTAITSAQNVQLTAREHILDDLISVEAATGKDVERFNESNMELNYDLRKYPMGLYNGAGLYFHAIDATARYNANAGWIEVPADPYLP